MPSHNASGTQHIQQSFPQEREHHANRRTLRALQRQEERETAAATRATARAAAAAAARAHARTAAQARAARADGRGSGGKSAGGKGDQHGFHFQGDSLPGSKGDKGKGKGKGGKQPIVINLMDGGPLESFILDTMTCFDTGELSNFVMNFHDIHATATMMFGHEFKTFHTFVLEALQAAQADYDKVGQTRNSHECENLKQLMKSLCSNCPGLETRLGWDLAQLCRQE